MAGSIVVGIVAAHDDRGLADALAAELPQTLRERVDSGADWQAEVCEVEPADVSANASELVEAVRRRLLERGWELGIGLTALPLRAGRRPAAAHASASHGVGLVSIPALGAVRRAERLRRAATQIVESLLGEPAAGAELASPIPLADAERTGTLRFTGFVARGNLRLLAGMIRANHPARLMARLSRAATAALGTAAYALTSSNLWLIAHQSSWPRLLAVAVLSLALILVALVLAHGLWERTKDPVARERVVLFNIVTVTTLAIGVATLYAALFLAMAVAGAIVLPAASLEHEIGRAPNVGDYLRLAWFVASVATVGGALGTLIESDEAVREAAYRRRAGVSEDAAELVNE